MMHPQSPQKAIAPGKIILSGEYAVVFGAPAIAIPSPLQTEVRFEPNQKSQGVTIENKSHPDSTYIQRIVELVEMQHGSLKGSLHIQSTIPVGCGMGSSTALVIAIARCLHLSKSEALMIEQTLNPNHSGIDFEVIWQNRPLKFIKGQEPEFITFDLSFLNEAILVDTGKPSEITVELVAWVKERFGNPHPNPLPAKGEGNAKLFRAKPCFNSPLPLQGERDRVRGAIETIGYCTERILHGENIKDVFRDHHRAQVALGIVPPNIQKFIEDIEKSGGAAKVLGAGGKTGGGGIVLVLHNDPSPIIASYDFRLLHAQHRLCEVLG